MSRSRLMGIGALPVALLLSVACGGDGGTTLPSSPPTTQPTTTPAPATPTTSAEPEPACHPSGAELEIEAEGFEFSTDCLAAPADTPFTITFNNNAVGVSHNVAILTTGAGPVTTVFEGDIFPGEATMTYQVDAIPAGIYRFECTVHPHQMVGEFVVE